MKHVLAALVGSATLSAGPAFAQQPLTLRSPDGTIEVRVELATDGSPRYAVLRRGETVIALSPLGLVYGEGDATGRSTLRELGRESIDRTTPLVASKAATARDRFNDLRLAIEPADAAGRRLELTLRAYDDGVAFRYRIPAGDRPLQLFGERTAFHLPADERCWGSLVGSITSSHEAEFAPFSPAKVRPFHLYDTAVACRTASGATSFLIAEADLDRYAGLYLRGRTDGGIGFDTQLATLPGETRVAVRAPAGQPIDSPWRLVLMADRAGDLLASNTIAVLNPPPAGDFSWVRPGKAAWDWWSGPYLPGIPPEPMSMGGLKALIDFAGKAGLPYMLIDEGWAFHAGRGGSAPADTDITRTQPDLDMPALVAYAKARRVELLLWIQWRHLDARLDEALDQYVRWGIKGIKVDFMDRNDQEMVAYYHRVITAAARHRLLVDFHGAYQPTGLARTWPNYVTQEGVMGAEANKWSRRITATHNVNLAFTRQVLGPMDYTPGGFRNRTPATFEIVNSPPQVQTTRGQALAMYVVYESPVAMVSDSPDAYVGQPEFAFIRDVPTTWDETRFLDGDLDSHVVVARRKGRDWYVGGMNAEVARPLSLPLTFLGPGHWQAEIWQDGAAPTKVDRLVRRLDARDRLDVAMSGSGGFVARLKRVD